VRVAVVSAPKLCAGTEQPPRTRIVAPLPPMRCSPKGTSLVELGHPKWLLWSRASEGGGRICDFFRYPKNMRITISPRTQLIASSATIVTAANISPRTQSPSIQRPPSIQSSRHAPRLQAWATTALAASLMVCEIPPRQTGDGRRISSCSRNDLIRRAKEIQRCYRSLSP
jgi:hypothetical protein